jgi:lactoylglutathione lyase
MKLNHLNLAVGDVLEARKFLEKYFGLRSMTGGDGVTLAGLLDDDGLVLTFFPSRCLASAERCS